MKQRIHIGTLEVGRAPLIVGVVSSPATLDRLLADPAPTLDIAELRLDLMAGQSDDWLEKAHRLEKKGIPVLITLRDRLEGGQWSGEPEERLALYQQALPWISAVDCEIERGGLDQIAAAAHAARRTVIGSFHDHRVTPNVHRLNGLVREARTRGADIVKLATVLTTDEDTGCLLDVMHRRADVHVCLLGMGPRGAEARVVFALAGSCLTYGYVDEPVVPDQPSCRDLRETLLEASPAYRTFTEQRSRAK